MTIYKTGAKRLGHAFDIGCAIAPVDLETGTNTGKRLAMANYHSVAFVVFCAAGSADDVQIQLQQHTAYTAGTSANLAIIDKYYVKSETTLDNDETWQMFTQAAAYNIAAVAGAGVAGAQQQIVVVEVNADSLDDGYTHVSLNIPDLGAGGAKLGGALYITEPLVRRKPENMPNMLRGDYTANA